MFIFPNIFLQHIWDRSSFELFSRPFIELVQWTFENIQSQQIDGEKVGKIIFYFLGLQNDCRQLLYVLVKQSCPNLCDPMDYHPPGSSVHGISQQEYWSGFPLPPTGDLPTQGSNPCLLHWRRILYCLSHQGSPANGDYSHENRRLSLEEKLWQIWTVY